MVRDIPCRSQARLQSAALVYLVEGKEAACLPLVKKLFRRIAADPGDIPPVFARRKGRGTTPLPLLRGRNAREFACVYDLISIFFALALSALGRETVRTPSLQSAVAFSDATEVGRGIARWKLP